LRLAAVLTDRFRQVRLAALLACGFLAAISLVAAPAAQAQMAPRDLRLQPVSTPPEPAPAPPATARHPQNPKVVSPVFPPGPAAGLCQCISDRNRRNMSCLASAAACQSVCGTTNYSLVPNAAFTCPLAPGEQLTQEQPPPALTQ
jgi:hypothetical protein